MEIQNGKSGNSPNGYPNSGDATHSLIQIDAENILQFSSTYSHNATN